MVPYIKKVNEEKSLLEAQKTLFVWDPLKAQSTAKVMDMLSKVGIESVMVPKDMTHLPLPVELATNTAFKKYEKRSFSKYFSARVTEALKTTLHVI